MRLSCKALQYFKKLQFPCTLFIYFVNCNLLRHFLPELHSLFLLVAVALAIVVNHKYYNIIISAKISQCCILSARYTTNCIPFNLLPFSRLLAKGELNGPPVD